MIETQLSTANRWRGQVYGPGLASTPGDLVIALGIPTTNSPVEPEPKAKVKAEVIAQVEPALELINSATTARAITAHSDGRGKGGGHHPGPAA